MKYYLLAGGFTCMEISIDDVLKFVKDKYGPFWNATNPVIDSNNINLVTQSTNFPVPVSYFYSIIMDDSFDALIDKKPGRRTVDRVLSLFKKSDMKEDVVMLEYGKYNVNFVYRIFSCEFLNSLNLTGEYAVDLKTALRLSSIGYDLSESPYRYKFVINGKKNYSPLCCLPESLHNIYINNLSQTVINTCSVNECLNMLCSMEGFRYYLYTYDDRDLLLYRVVLIYGNKTEKHFNSYSRRECMLLAINRIIDIIKGINHEDSR